MTVFGHFISQKPAKTRLLACLWANQFPKRVLILIFSHAIILVIADESGQITSQINQNGVNMNPLAKLLGQFVQYRSRKATKDEIATQLGISRRTLYNACQPDQNVERFTVGTLLKITSHFPLTVIISRGKKEA